MDKNFLNAADHHPAAFFRLINNPTKFKLFLLSKLPAAFASGLQMHHCDEQTCTVSVPFKWFTQNPFRSTYFACLAMAAELTTGALVMAQIYKRKPSMSMLITSMESKYYKKATDRTNFICADGAKIKEAIDEAYMDTSGRTITVQSKGFNKKNEPVADFWFTWSFKVKQ